LGEDLFGRVPSSSEGWKANKEKPSGRKSYQDGFFMAKYSYIALNALFS